MKFVDAKLNWPGAVTVSMIVSTVFEGEFCTAFTTLLMPRMTVRLPSGIRLLITGTDTTTSVWPALNVTSTLVG